MRLEAARYAVGEFNKLRAEHAEIIEAMGMAALTCLVRQRRMDSDNGWACEEIGVTDDVFWGRFSEKRHGSRKQVLIIIDLDDVDSIEFEVYDGKTVEG